MGKTLVLGIGNTLMSDEGVGVHVINLLQQRHPDLTEVSFIDGGTLSFTLAGLLASHDHLIVIDAAKTGSEPGRVVCHEEESMDRYLTGNRQSVHEVGLTDLLDIARLSDHYPVHRALIGIEPYSMEWGEQPTEQVAPAVPLAAGLAMALVEKWSSDPRD